MFRSYLNRITRLFNWNSEMDSSVADEEAVRANIVAEDGDLAVSEPTSTITTEVLNENYGLVETNDQDQSQPHENIDVNDERVIHHNAIDEAMYDESDYYETDEDEEDQDVYTKEKLKALDIEIEKQIAELVKQQELTKTLEKRMKENEDSNMTGVEGFILKLKRLRENRLKSPFPSKISLIEKEMVKDALENYPKNPLVFLAVLDIISDRKGKISEAFKLACRNMYHSFEDSSYILVQMAKYFLKNNRDRDFAYQCIKKAYSHSPMNAEINFICGKYLCTSNKGIDFGLGAKDSFLHAATTSDPSNFEYVMEFYQTLLGNLSFPHSNLSGPLGTSWFDFKNENEGDVNHFLIPLMTGIQLVGRSPDSKSWTKGQRCQLHFLASLCAYLRDDSEEALDFMLPIYKNNHVISMIRSMNKLCGVYNWDRSRLSFDKYKKWLLIEFEKITSSNDVVVLDDSDLEMDFFENDENDDLDDDEKDPFEDMLAYLIRIL